MTTYRNNLPQMQDKIFITEAGMETEFLFKHGIELPEFASYNLLKTQEGYQMLYDYYASFAQLASMHKMGAVLETPTWRANQDWAEKLGDSPEQIRELNCKAVELLEHVRAENCSEEAPLVISGNLGPRGDGYTPDTVMSIDEAKQYHLPQIKVFAETNADLVSVLTMNYIEEAIGIVLAAEECDMPIVVSFTLETDGCLPTGQSLQSAIEKVDASTNNGPLYYMINCAHPTHFDHLFTRSNTWARRIKGIRGNASRCSHEELDNSTELDEGNPEEFGRQCADLRAMNPQLNVLGGCCGTDKRHIEEICRNVS